jgi:hypothetical protein
MPVNSREWVVKPLKKLVFEAGGLAVGKMPIRFKEISALNYLHEAGNRWRHSSLINMKWR